MATDGYHVGYQIKILSMCVIGYVRLFYIVRISVLSSSQIKISKLNNVYNVYFPYQCADNYNVYMDYVGKLMYLFQSSSTPYVYAIGDYNANLSRDGLDLISSISFGRELKEMCDNDRGCYYQW